jgi:polyhydroxybutyrate depolymerase
MDTRTRISIVLSRAVSAACLLFILSSCGSDSPVDPIPNPGDFNRTMRSGSRDRVYDVHVPSTVNPAQPSPLVILLHGVPRLSGMAVITGFDEVADRFGYIVAYPRAFQTLDWNVGCELCSSAAIDDVDDVGFIRDLIEDLAAQVAIDRSRVYVAGFSQGALMTHFLGCELADEIAAFGSVAATMIDEVEQGCSPSRPAPWLFIQGTDDAEFPWEGRVGELSTTISARATIATWTGLNGCSADPAVTELPDMEDDGTTVTLEEYRGCSGGAELDFYVVNGGGHTWPGAPVEFVATKSLEIDASELLAEFFSRH